MDRAVSEVATAAIGLEVGHLIWCVASVQRLQKMGVLLSKPFNRCPQEVIQSDKTNNHLIRSAWYVNRKKAKQISLQASHHARKEAHKIKIYRARTMPPLYAKKCNVLLKYQRLTGFAEKRVLGVQKDTTHWVNLCHFLVKSFPRKRGGRW